MTFWIPLVRCRCRSDATESCLFRSFFTHLRSQRSVFSFRVSGFSSSGFRNHRSMTWFTGSRARCEARIGLVREHLPAPGRVPNAGRPTETQHGRQPITAPGWPLTADHDSGRFRPPPNLGFIHFLCPRRRHDELARHRRPGKNDVFMNARP